MVCLLPAWGGGCTISYYDRQTGIEHIWGLTHVKIKVSSPTGSVTSVATQSEAFGAGLSLGEESYGQVGWARRTRVRMPDDAGLSLEWQSYDLLDVRLGDTPHFLPVPETGTALQPTPTPPP